MEEMTQRLDDKTDKLESFSKRDNLKFFIVAESTEADIYILWMAGTTAVCPYVSTTSEGIKSTSSSTTAVNLLMENT